MDISTAISGDPCSEKLLPVGSTEILIQGESGDVYGNGPKTYILGGLVFLGAPPACCVNTRDMMWVDAGAGTWRKLREWCGLGKQEVRLMQHGGRKQGSYMK